MAIEEKDKSLLTKSSIDIQLLPESLEDSQLAELFKLQAAKDEEQIENEKIQKIIDKPALSTNLTISDKVQLKRERVFDKRLSQSQLGIVVKKPRVVIEPKPAEDNASIPFDISQDNSTIQSKSLLLLGDYGSSSENSDNDK